MLKCAFEMNDDRCSREEGHPGKGKGENKITIRVVLIIMSKKWGLRSKLGVEGVFREELWKLPTTHQVDGQNA